MVNTQSRHQPAALPGKRRRQLPLTGISTAVGCISAVS